MSILQRSKKFDLNEKFECKTGVYGTRYSQAVTHPGTNRARRCLTSVIRRELVLSRWYGRRHLDNDITVVIEQSVNVQEQFFSNIVTVQRPPNFFTFVVRRRATTQDVLQQIIITFFCQLFNVPNKTVRTCSAESYFSQSIYWGPVCRLANKKLSGAGVPLRERKKLSLERMTCLADKTNHPVERLSLNRSQCGSCSTKYDTSAGT